MRKYVVIGDTREARRTCSSLTSLGHDVRHLHAPTDHQLGEGPTSDVEALIVLLHSDTGALRYCLAAERLHPGLQMHVAVFDRTVRSHLTNTLPDCQVLSPADVALPYLVAACLDDVAIAIVRTGHRTWEARTGGEEVGRAFAVPARMRAAGIVGRVLGQLRSHDSGSRILLTGLFGLLALLVIDTSLGVAHLNETWIDSLHAAVQTVATVGPVLQPDAEAYQLFSAIAMLSGHRFHGHVHGRHCGALAERAFRRTRRPTRVAAQRACGSRRDGSSRHPVGGGTAGPGRCSGRSGPRPASSESAPRPVTQRARAHGGRWTFASSSPPSIGQGSGAVRRGVRRAGQRGGRRCGQEPGTRPSDRHLRRNPHNRGDTVPAQLGNHLRRHRSHHLLPRHSTAENSRPL